MHNSKSTPPGSSYVNPRERPCRFLDRPETERSAHRYFMHMNRSRRIQEFVSITWDVHEWLFIDVSHCSCVIYPLSSRQARQQFLLPLYRVVTVIPRCIEFNGQIYLFLRPYQTDNSLHYHHLARLRVATWCVRFRCSDPRTEIGRGCRKSWSSLSYRFQEGKEKPEDHPAQSWLAVGVHEPDFQGRNVWSARSPAWPMVTLT